MADKNQIWHILYGRHVLVMGLDADDAELAVLRRHAGAQITWIRPVRSGHLPKVSETLSRVEAEQSYNLNLTEREIAAVRAAVTYCGEHPEAGVQPVPGTRTNDDEPSGLETALEKLELAVPPIWRR